MSDMEAMLFIAAVLFSLAFGFAYLGRRGNKETEKRDEDTKD